jgi:hypothetical protein
MGSAGLFKKGGGAESRKSIKRRVAEQRRLNYMFLIFKSRSS